MYVFATWEEYRVKQQADRVIFPAGWRLYWLPMPNSNDPQAKKEMAMKFHEASLKNAGAEQERREAMRERRLDVEHKLEQHAKEEALADAERAVEEREKKKEWRKSEAQKKTEIAADKERRAQEAAHIKERIEKEKKLEEAQRKFFESFREAASQKAMKQRMLDEKAREYKDAITKADADAREKKRKIETEESLARNALDHRDIEEKHAIEKAMHKLRDTLFAEEQRKKQELEQFKKQGDAVYRARAQELASAYQKKRTELDIEERTKMEFHRQNILKERKAIEKKCEDRRAQADNEYRETKSDMLRRLDKLRYGLPKEDEK